MLKKKLFSVVCIYKIKDDYVYRGSFTIFKGSLTSSILFHYGIFIRCYENNAGDTYNFNNQTTEQFVVEPAVPTFPSWHCYWLEEDKKYRQHNLKDKCLSLMTFCSTVNLPKELRMRIHKKHLRKAISQNGLKLFQN